MSHGRFPSRPPGSTGALARSTGLATYLSKFRVGVGHEGRLEHFLPCEGRGKPLHKTHPTYRASLAHVQGMRSLRAWGLRSLTYQISGSLIPLTELLAQPTLCAYPLGSGFEQSPRTSISPEGAEAWTLSGDTAY